MQHIIPHTGELYRRRLYNMRNCLANIFAGLILSVCSGNYFASTHEVGFASLDITPGQKMIDTGEVFMGGYGFWKNRGAAENIHDPLKASAICISDPSNELCVVVLDNLGLSGPICNKIRTKIHEITGIPISKLFVAATHTHAAPDLLGLWGGSPDTYLDHLINQASRAVAEAYLDRQPANLFYSTTQGNAYNRRGWNTTDTSITIIEALAEDGTRLGSLVNFAAHPVVSRAENRGISSDYVHYLRAHLEQLSGAPVVYVNGAIGDVNPLEKRVINEWKVAETYGEAIASKAFNAMLNPHAISPGIEILTADFTTNVDNTVLALAQFFGVLDNESSGPPWNIALNSRVGKFRLGNEVEAVIVPGEALTRLGKEIKAEMTTPVKLFFGLTGGSLGYLIPPDEWETGRNNNYEESVSLGKHIGYQIRDLLTSLRFEPAAKLD